MNSNPVTAGPPARPAASRALSVWLLLLLLALFGAFGLFDHSLWSANDTREGAMIREMFREHVWVTPVFNGRPYLEKPPLLHWTALLCCRAAGTVNEGLVRLPAALYGLGAAVIVWLWGRRLERERAGLAAAFLCATAVLYLEYSRVVLTDTALTFMVMLALFLFWRAFTAGRRWQWGLFLLAAAASFYAKGLVGPGMIWVAVSVFLLWRRQWRTWLALALCFAPVAVLVVGPWLAALWRAGGREFLTAMLWDNQFGRFFTFGDLSLPVDPYFVHKEPWWFYLVHAWPRLLPWTLLAPPALVYWFRRRPPAGMSGAPGMPAAAFLRCALLGMVLVLQVSTAKAECYLLPLFPPLFLMVGIWLEDAAAIWHSRLERGLILATAALLALGALGMPLAYLGCFLARADWIWLPGPAAAWTGLGLALAALAAAAGLARRLGRQFAAGERAAAWLELPAAAALLMLLNAAAFLPAYDCQRSYRPFAELARAHLQQGRRIALAGDRERDLGAFMFYLDRRLPALPLDNGAAWERWLGADAAPVGVIVSERDLTPLARVLVGRTWRVVRCAHGGYKSAEFRLLLGGGQPTMPGRRIP